MGGLPRRAAVWLVINVGAKSADGSRPHGSVIEVAATGRLVRTLSSTPFADSDPGGAVASAGNQVWVTDSRFLSNAEGWVTELSPQPAPSSGSSPASAI